MRLVSLTCTQFWLYILFWYCLIKGATHRFWSDKSLLLTGAIFLENLDYYIQKKKSHMNELFSVCSSSWSTSTLRDTKLIGKEGGIPCECKHCKITNSFVVKIMYIKSLYLVLFYYYMTKHITNFMTFLFIKRPTTSSNMGHKWVIYDELNSFLSGLINVKECQSILKFSLF